MSAATQAIINGASAAALWTSPMPAGPCGTGWACPQLVVRPRGRRPALADRQDA
ncbi:hypothetical protein [Streptomyces sp. WMMB 322]|uniref:hypothetical protein n=1 Tax=Streptomyces sp. WMMB 322 TaxID=1286821 RepID=UPI000A9C13DD|nr:hypothetical protein [Streptomyces sp. WMMB 322]